VSELDEVRREVTGLRAEVAELRMDLSKVCKAVVGNGEYDNALISRVQRLEYRIGATPTWQWVVEKLALPVAVGLALYFASR
jgi:hypothetical protein